MKQEFDFITGDEREAELVSSYGILMLQVGLILKRHAASGDFEALQWFDETYQEISSAAHELCRRKLQ